MRIISAGPKSVSAEIMNKCWNLLVEAVGWEAYVSVCQRATSRLVSRSGTQPRPG